MPPVAALRRALGRWGAHALLVSSLATALEIGATFASFPSGLSRPTALGALWLGTQWVMVAWLLPLAAVGALLDARGTLQRWLRWRDAPLHLLAVAVLCVVARWTSDSALLKRVQVLQAPIHLVFLGATLGATWVGLLTARSVVERRLGTRLSALAEHGMALSSALLGLLLFGVIHAVLAPANADAAVLPLGVLYLGCLLLGSRALFPGLPSLSALGAMGFLLAWLAALPLSSRSEHALFVLRGHCPVATSLYRPWDTMADLDGDGARNRWWGGTDCDDLRAGVGPLSLEIPGDHLDQDCRGGDAAPRARLPSAPPWLDCQLPAPPPSVLLITIDALRADGLDAELAPELYGFATRAAVFERAYSPASMTGGTTLSIFTGRAMSDLNRQNVYTDRTLNVSNTITTAFRHADYHTFALLPFELHPELTTGFERMRHARPRDVTVQRRKRLVAAELSNQLMEELSGTRGRFFAWLHYPDLHAPYVMKRDTDPGTAAAYLRALSYVDAHLGRVLRFLEQSGALESTLVVISADHGEQLGQRGREGHGPFLFEEGIRVPLVLWVPGCPARRVTHPVSLRHFAGTLHALTGIGDPQPTWFAESELPVVVEEPSGPWNGVKRAIIVGQHKLLVDQRHGGKMLFDLDHDPDERENLYGREIEVTRRLERAYQRWLDAPGLR